MIPDPGILNPCSGLLQVSTEEILDLRAWKERNILSLGFLHAFQIIPLRLLAPPSSETRSASKLLIPDARIRWEFFFLSALATRYHSGTTHGKAPSLKRKTCRGHKQKTATEESFLFMPRTGQQKRVTFPGRDILMKLNKAPSDQCLHLNPDGFWSQIIHYCGVGVRGHFIHCRMFRTRCQ